jgi:hypothetical protein
LTIDAPMLYGIGGYWAFSAVVGGMPPPDEKSSKGYVWMHNSLHILAGNITRAVQTRYPSLPAGAEITQQTATTITTPKETP